jgi:hypothetical protein
LLLLFQFINFFFGRRGPYDDDEIKEDEMDGECSTHGEMRNAQKFWLESLRGRDQSQDLGVDWRVILKWIMG